MVLVNSIVFLLILVLFFLYIYLYPKKKLNYPLLLIIASCLPLISIFRKGAYESGDFVYHLYRAIAFNDSLLEGILIPSWAGRLNGGYGYPVFIFIYNIPYYLLSFVHSLGFTWITSEKILLAFLFIASGFSMFLLLKKLVKNDIASFAGSIVYLFAPYHLVDLHFRVALAELTAFVIAPLIFLLVVKIAEKSQTIYLLWLGLLFGVLFLDHPPMFIFYSVILFLFISYQVFFLKSYKVITLFYTGLAFFIGLSISSYSWLARFTLTQFTHGSILTNTIVEFVNPIDILISPWRYGFLFQGHKGELSFIIGYTQILVIIFSLLLLFKRKFDKNIARQLIFWISIIAVMIFLMLPYSRLIWQIVPFINLMQFSYRFLHPISFSVSIITAYIFLQYRNKRIIFIFVVLTIGYTILNWGNRGMVQTNDLSIERNLERSTSEGEGMIEGAPLWWKSKGLWITTIPKESIEVIEGNAEIEIIRRTTTKHEYNINAKSSVTILENTFYFPDWKITVDGKPVKVEYKNEMYPARMIFDVPKGNHRVSVIYSDIPALKYAKIASITIILVICIYTLIYLMNKNHEGKKRH